MTKQRRPLTPDAIGLLIALLGLLPGGFIYLYQPWQAGFPINDGGLFYAVIRAVQSNGFRLPDFVSYNGLQIPFFYSPLGFYLGAALSSLLQVDALLILQWVPAVILIIIGACFYFAAREFL
ncbi:MAG TPA: hypothetical protein VLL49_05660, partial [Anaerolineales bacterium]|nr:hypothetical protein [Anaerolineales bacterium]